ncbi:MAG TPA: class I SAM-dependent methyltransferase [Chthonomonadaceae bacterium]|nr:class I SAM-dependent methyltransferase [Chthonomonadaceae bacterium]
METEDSVRALNEESQTIWDTNAAFWDDYMGDAGNDFHRELVAPSAERLMALQPGETVLEIACGAGLFARQMAQAGAQVVATDFSAVFLQRAQERAKACAGRIEFRQIDATDAVQLLSLGERRFDAAVSNMALMDMPAIEPLLSALSRLLKPGGRFVFTIMHPCFNNNGCIRVVEESDAGGEFTLLHSVKISKYLSVEAAKGIGIRGQPVPQYYFHRPLHLLFAACFRAGFVLDGLEEPGFHGVSRDRRSVSPVNFREIPMVLAARLRLL